MDSHQKQRGADALLSQSQADRIDQAEWVESEPSPNAQISIPLTPPLLERLDRMAEKQNRKRSNLIQHILWEYVMAVEGKR